MIIHIKKVLQIKKDKKWWIFKVIDFKSNKFIINVKNRIEFENYLVKNQKFNLDNFYIKKIGNKLYQLYLK